MDEVDYYMEVIGTPPRKEEVEPRWKRRPRVESGDKVEDTYMDIEG